MKSFQVLLSELQPEAFIVNNVKDVHEAVEKALVEAWEKYPGFFTDAPETQNCFEYEGKYLRKDCPSTQEITWN